MMFGRKEAGLETSFDDRLSFFFRICFEQIKFLVMTFYFLCFLPPSISLFFFFFNAFKQVFFSTGIALTLPFSQLPPPHISSSSLSSCLIFILILILDHCFRSRAILLLSSLCYIHFPTLRYSHNGSIIYTIASFNNPMFEPHYLRFYFTHLIFVIEFLNFSSLCRFAPLLLA